MERWKKTRVMNERVCVGLLFSRPILLLNVLCSVLSWNITSFPLLFSSGTWAGDFFFFSSFLWLTIHPSLFLPILGPRV